MITAETTFFIPRTVPYLDWAEDATAKHTFVPQEGGLIRNKMKTENHPRFFKMEYHHADSELIIKPHYHNCHEIVYIQQGRGDFEISGKRYQAKAPSLLFINHFETHVNDITRYPYASYFMLVPPEFFHQYVKDPLLLSLLNTRPQDFTHLIRLKPTEPIQVEGLILKIFDEYCDPSPYSQDAIGNLFSLFLIYMYRSHPDFFQTKVTNHTLDLITRVQNYIRDHFAMRLTLSMTADRFNIDKYYLSHLFRSVTGFTFKDYLIRQRLSKAKDLLINTEKSVTQVCEEAGFNNINHFIRIFKTKEGTTPLRFRKTIVPRRSRQTNVRPLS